MEDVRASQQAVPAGDLVICYLAALYRGNRARQTSLGMQSFIPGISVEYLGSATEPRIGSQQTQTRKRAGRCRCLLAAD